MHNWGLAYTISNENQRWATQVIPGVKNVLTVAGSGDQAIFYKLSGAKIVDTFDITSNARVIQDIKYVAIKHMDHCEYKNLLIQLHMTCADEIKNILQHRNLWQFMPTQSREIIINKDDELMFGSGLNANNYPWNIPTKQEYEKLNELLDKPFNFIWSDLESLGTKLIRKYDIINISNIFDFCSDVKTQEKILNDLSEYLDNDGRIVCLPQTPENIDKKVKPAKLVYEKTISDNNYTRIIMFQKTK